MDFHKYTGDSYAVVFTKVMPICQYVPFLTFNVVNEKVCGMTPCSCFTAPLTHPMFYCMFCECAVCSSTVYSSAVYQRLVIRIFSSVTVLCSLHLPATTD